MHYNNFVLIMKIKRYHTNLKSHNVKIEIYSKTKNHIHTAI